MGELSCVETQRSSRVIGEGHERVDLLGRHQVAGGKGQIGYKKNS